MAVLDRLRRIDAERRSAAFDVLLAVALTVLLQLQVWFGEEEGEVFELKPLSAALMLLLTVPLVWRRRTPLAVAACNGLGRAAQALATGSWVATHGTTLPSIVALYSAGAYGRGSRAWLGLSFVVAGVTVAAAYDIPETEADLWNGLFFYLLAFLVFAAGLYVGGRRRSAELQLKTERLERERAEQSQAVAEERARIARELHDVVAHSVSATVVQAEAAEEVLSHAPDRARQSLARIQDTGREALGEMRRLLGIMRDAPGGEELAPQPRVADLERMVEESQAEDLSVTLTVEGELRELPAGVELSAYRIIQEALTNVRKHAGRPANASVVVRYGEAALELEIVDDGQGLSAEGGQGHGLVGMRERVAFFGGEFSAGPGKEGGFVVRARFPLPAVQR
jgi:signal transduction histidine kinase